jgi:formate hydrogenlyase transcriptional activator
VISVDEAWFQPNSGDQCNALPMHSTEEKVCIEAALKESRGRISGARGAATRLGIPRTTLEAKIKRLTINKYKYQAVHS